MNIGKSWVHFSEMTWSRPIGSSDDLNRKLRYTEFPLTKEERITVASILSSYKALVFKTQRQRNEICKVLQQVEKNEILEKNKGF